MADGRKNNGGHSTKGKAGRKSKAEEIQLAETMDNILDYPDALYSLAQLVRSGDIQAVKLWLEYRLGKPQQRVDLTTKGNQFPSTIIISSPDDGEN